MTGSVLRRREAASFDARHLEEMKGVTQRRSPTPGHPDNVDLMSSATFPGFTQRLCASSSLADPCRPPAQPTSQ
jgi:hypothetical protein